MFWGFFFFFFFSAIAKLFKQISLLTLFLCCDFWNVYLDSEINLAFLRFGLHNKINTFFLVSDFPGGAVVRIHLPVQELQEAQVRSLAREDPLE